VLEHIPRLGSYTPAVEPAGLDDDKLSMLAKWAGGLRLDPRAEVAAAGRAIEMLIDEVERLNVLIWDEQLESSAPAPASDPPPEPAAPAEDLLLPLRARLRQRRAAPTASTGSPQAESAADGSPPAIAPG
jgi:hypothetical protein